MFSKYILELRLLDPSLTNLQVRNVGKALKNKDNIIEVPFLIKNLTGINNSQYSIGSVYETVDFTKRLMTEIKQFLDKNTRYNDLRQYFEVDYIYIYIYIGIGREPKWESNSIRI